MHKMPQKNNMKYVSVVCVHYSKADDFGEFRAKKCPKTRSEMLRDCMKSLEENTEFPIELIVIDNGGNPDDSNYLIDLVRRGIVNTYVRNKNNMHFGWAFNQGIKLATSPYICLTCNDIYFKKGWLIATMNGFLKHGRSMKLIASPFVSEDKTKGKNPRGTLEDGYRLNSMTGSNCMLLTKKIYNDIGAMTTHHITGSHWHRRMNKKGYLVIVPPENMVEDMAFGMGTQIRNHIKVAEQLNKGEVDFTFPYTK